MINLPQREGEDRKTYLVRLAIEYINSESGYDHNQQIFYDEAECDGYCLAEDLRLEFNIEEG